MGKVVIQKGKIFGVFISMNLVLNTTIDIQFSNDRDSAVIDIN